VYYNIDNPHGSSLWLKWLNHFKSFPALMVIQISCTTSWRLVRYFGPFSRHHRGQCLAVGMERPIWLMSDPHSAAMSDDYVWAKIAIISLALGQRVKSINRAQYLYLQVYLYLSLRICICIWRATCLVPHPSKLPRPPGWAWDSFSVLRLMSFLQGEKYFINIIY